MDGDTMLGHMSPVVHHKDWNLIRVPLRKIEDKYDVFVSDDLVRHYDERTLPDVLKSKMAMILASPQPNLIPDERLQKLNVYSVTMPELALVGWRVSETWFCLAIDRLTLNSLKGGTVTKENENA
jgi:hypothetical protein